MPVMQRLEYWKTLSELNLGLSISTAIESGIEVLDCDSSRSAY